MLFRSLSITSALFWLVASTSLKAQTSYPMLMSIEPAAVQAGSSSVHTLKSRYSLQGAFEVSLSGEGVRGEVIAPSEESKDSKGKSVAENLKVRFTAEPNALPGIRDIRVATPRGASTVGQLVVTSDPVIYEQGDNDKPESAQRVDLPGTLCGHIEKAEDVDYFRFQVDAGKTFCFHVLCMRIEDRIHDLQTHADPILTIRDSNGSVVAYSDNELQGDPLVCHTFARAGEYTLEIRDVRFQGNAYWEYCVEINDRPMVTTTFPVAVSPKNSSQVSLIGYGLSSDVQAEVCSSGARNEDIQWLPVKVAPNQIRPLPFAVADLPAIMEGAQENQSIDNAQPIALPLGIHGKMEKEGDVDCFAFDAKKGERFTFEVFARRVGSALDSQIRILDGKGNQIQLSDDMRLGKRNYSDSWLENWTVPADGKYFLEIRDLHLRGGPSFVYFVKATKSQPYFLLYADTDKTPLTPGTTGVVFVRSEKKNGFDGEIQLQVEGLPPGVKAHCGRILAGKSTDGCIIFEASADAKPAIQNIVIRGTAKGKDGDSSETLHSAEAAIYQEIYQPGGGRGHWPVDSHVLSITEPGDLRKVEVNVREMVFKPGESKEIEVQLERAPGFDKNVTLEVTYMHLSQIFGSSLPEGISVDANASNTLLTNGASKGKIVLKAAPNAPPVEQQQILVMANVSLNFVMKATYGSKPILITITKE